MALSTEAQAQLNELTKKRLAKKSTLDANQRDYERLGLELRALLVQLGVSHATTSDGYSVELTEIVDWRNLNADMVEHDFPRDEYPELYTPEYQRVKAAANERVSAKDPDSTAAVSKYTGFTTQLRIRKLKQWRTKNRRAR